MPWPEPSPVSQVQRSRQPPRLAPDPSLRFDMPRFQRQPSAAEPPFYFISPTPRLLHAFPIFSFLPSSEARVPLRECPMGHVLLSRIMNVEFNPLLLHSLHLPYIHTE